MSQGQKLCHLVSIEILGDEWERAWEVEQRIQKLCDMVQVIKTL